MTTHIDLSTEGPTSEGLRALLGRETGHLASADGVLFLAETTEHLEEWIDLPLTPEIEARLNAPVEAIEVETRQISETLDDVAVAIQSEDAENHEESSTETDASDDANSSDDGQGGDNSAGDLIDEGSPVATRSDVVARIRTRAHSYTKTTGARQTRRVHSGRSLQ